MSESSRCALPTRENSVCCFESLQAASMAQSQRWVPFLLTCIPGTPESPCVYTLVFSCWLTIGRNLTDLWFTVGTCSSREHYKTKGTISCFLETMVLKHPCYNSPSRYRVLESRSQQPGILAEYGDCCMEGSASRLGYSLSMQAAEWDTRWICTTFR